VHTSVREGANLALIPARAPLLSRNLNLTRCLPCFACRERDSSNTTTLRPPICLISGHFVGFAADIGVFPRFFLGKLRDRGSQTFAVVHAHRLRYASWFIDRGQMGVDYALPAQGKKLNHDVERLL